MVEHALTHDPRDPSRKVTHLTHWPMTHRPIACSAIVNGSRNKGYKIRRLVTWPWPRPLRGHPTYRFCYHDGLYVKFTETQRNSQPLNELKVIKHTSYLIHFYPLSELQQRRAFLKNRPRTMDLHEIRIFVGGILNNQNATHRYDIQCYVNRFSRPIMLLRDPGIVLNVI